LIFQDGFESGETSAWSSTVSPLDASFTFEYAPGNGFTVEFTDQSSGAVESWSWDFGDGTMSSMPSPTHTYPVSGTFTASLTVSDGSATSTTTRTVSVPGPARF
ncbi:MAG: PKD domain-containing protein, partial [Acidobacteriota bacterium]